jgi:hypothetical protein
MPSGQPTPHESPAFDRYGQGMRRVSGQAEAFGADYPIPVSVRVAWVRGC